MKTYPIIIVGGGPAGIGIAALLSRCAMPALVLERGRVGETFLRWPEETQFISPSFTGNFFGAIDLNAITPGSSPAYELQAEHPRGLQYAKYIRDVANFYGLQVDEGIEVLDIEVEPNGKILLSTNEGEVRTRVLIWAGGEFQYQKNIPHTLRVDSSYKTLPVQHHVIIGGSESGMETAYNLVKNGSSVSIIDPTEPWARKVSDSSYGLSPFTFARVRALQKSGRAEFISEYAETISKHEVRTQSRTFKLEHPALNATGFDIEQSLAGKLFKFADGHPQLTEHDESTKHKNVYLVGPNVQHEKAIFCFIYKFRQRFAVVVREILKRWGEESSVIAEYADRGFLLEDLSCCDGECEC
ncbi:MAG: NAD(P)-binding domain-containing protein [Pseudomonadota bacterium]